MRVENDFAIISIGTDDGLRIGSGVEFVRNGSVISTGTVVEPEFTMAACRCAGSGLPADGDLARLIPKPVSNEY